MIWRLHTGADGALGIVGGVREKKGFLVVDQFAEQLWVFFMAKASYNRIQDLAE